MNGMNQWFRLCGFALLVNGCAVEHALQVAGPHRTDGPALGSLVVYSAPDGLDTGGPDHEKHTSYTIPSETGTVVEKIRNRCGSFGSDPATVALLAGTYAVKARATTYGVIRVPVQIQRNQTTVLYLDGSTKPVIELAGADLIRSPKGQIVGRWVTGPPP